MLAASLNNLDTPTLIQMNQIKSQDKSIWKHVYDEEYYDLYNLSAWTSISETVC